MSGAAENGATGSFGLVTTPHRAGPQNDTRGGTEGAASATGVQSGFPRGEETPEPQKVFWSSP